MEEQILSNLDKPGQLEQLYRADKPTFKRAFNALYPELKDNRLISFWNERLNFAGEEIRQDTRKDLWFVLIASLLAGFIAKLPALMAINGEFFYSRNIGFILFPALFTYFSWKNKLAWGKIAWIAGLTLLSLLFMNVLPDERNSDTVRLSCLHVVFFLWLIGGFSFVGETGNNVERRLGYLKYNGDLVVITTLMLIAGGILTGMTIGLFRLIGFQIETFYVNNVVVFGLPAAPIIGTYLTQTNPQLVGKISPVIAKLFSPLVLIMLVSYLFAILFSGKNPYNNREFLLLFNALLIGVMAIIFFSIAGTSKATKSYAEIWILFLLCVVTLLVNGIALSAILFRISEWGMTPNRAAVLGSNVVILLHLLLVTAQFFRILAARATISQVGNAIAAYLPVYGVWIIVVTFIFPVLFGLK